MRAHARRNKVDEHVIKRHGPETNIVDQMKRVHYGKMHEEPASTKYATKFTNYDVMQKTTTDDKTGKTVSEWTLATEINDIMKNIY